jgi:hypothetical protein
VRVSKGPHPAARPSLVRRRFLDAPTSAFYDSSIGRRYVSEEVPMVAVIGNVIAGLLALSLFTATVRLTK